MDGNATATTLKLFYAQVTLGTSKVESHIPPTSVSASTKGNYLTLPVNQRALQD